MIELLSGSATHVGLVREQNEDGLLAAAPVFLVADGMGGHEAGEVASAIVVEEFSRLVGAEPSDVDSVRAAFERAHTRVVGLAGDDGEPLQAGTTVTAAVHVLHEGEPAWLLLNCGDSRVYRFADDELRQVSVDHSLVQEMVDDGVLTAEEARRHPGRHVVTRSVGVTGAVPRPDLWLLPVVPGERLLLCTDGLTNEVDDASLAGSLQGGGSPQQVADELVAAALDAGGHDNVTVVVVDVPAAT